jgi:hypothetical protein
MVVIIAYAHVADQNHDDALPTMVTSSKETALLLLLLRAAASVRE